MSNQYTYSVPFTEKQLVHDYLNLGMTQAEIGVKYGTTQHVVWRAMEKMSIKARRAAKRNQLRENNTSWKGGRVLVAKKRSPRNKFVGNGYYYVLAPEHPNANKSGYVAEHIIVATKKRGYSLRKNEVVHHINLNRHDNRSENLCILTRKTHAIWHAQFGEIAVALIRHGEVSFSPSKGYKLKLRTVTLPLH